MDNPFTLLVLASVILAFFLGWRVYDSYERELDPLPHSSDSRYQPFMNSFIMVYYMVLFLFQMHFGISTVALFQNTPYFWTPLVLDISLSYLLLFLLMPVLHKFLSARTCSVLWLVPAFLYFTHAITPFLSAPSLVLPLPGWIAEHLETLGVIWFSGAILFLGWRCVSHLLFRYRLLHTSYTVEEEEVREVWRQERRFAGMEATEALPLPLYAPSLKSPLSIGFTKRSTRILLPEKDYTSEELHLIFRHELVHIGRQDCLSKFFITFYTALCWFNPLVWLAARRGADELELSCDETVLLNSDQEERELYADLLLRTAGEQRGFTTCLSASASALRFRLRNVIRPSKKVLGWFVVAMAVPLLILGSGRVTVSYAQGTGQELIFNQAELTEYQYIKHSGPSPEVDPLIQYLSGLNFTAITGQYTLEMSTQTHGGTVFYRCGDSSILLTITDLGVVVKPVESSGALTRIYLVDDPIDWELVYSLFPGLA